MEIYSVGNPADDVAWGAHMDEHAAKGEKANFRVHEYH